MRSRSWLRCAIATAMALSASDLTGCGVVDQFSGRYAEYNRQVEQSQEEMLLLNIVRAMNRRPMQFTAFTQLQAQATIAGQATIGLPFGHHPNTAPRSLSLQSGTSSAQNQMQISVLDTQEYYNGIMRPIAVSFIDLYLRGRYPSEQVLTLLIHEIDIQKTTQGKDGKYEANPDDSVLPFVNYPPNDFDLDLFHVLLEHLLDEHHLRTAKVRKLTLLGPPFAINKDTELKDMVSAASANLEIKKIDELTKETKETCVGYQGKGACYQLQKTDESVGFCVGANTATCDAAKIEFEPDKSKVRVAEENVEHAETLLTDLAEKVDEDCYAIHDDHALHTKYCTLAKKFASPNEPRGCSQLTKMALHATPFDQFERTNLSPETFPETDVCYRYVIRLLKKVIEDKKRPLAYTFYMRSVESLVYYLGEISRRQLEPPSGWPRRAEFVKIVEPDEKYRSVICKPYQEKGPVECKRLFDLLYDAGGSFIAVEYEGKWFALSNDGRSDWSYPTLELVKQLFSLNLSVKDLPTTITVPVLAPP